MYMNPFYITHKTIMNRLARVHKGKHIHEADVIEWSAECITEYIEDFDSMIRYDDVLLTAESDGRFYLPCLTYRILDVHNGASRVPYLKKGIYIVLPESKATQIYINYIGIPVSDDGELLVDKNHAQAVEAFIVHKMYYEDYLNGKIHPNMWMDIKMTLENELLASKSSFRHWDQSKFDTIQAIRGNIVPQLASTPLFKIYNIAGK